MDVPRPTGPFAQDLYLREELGFRTDLDYLRRLHHQLERPGGGPLGVTEGLLAVPLTAAETADVRQRSEVSYHDGPIVRAYLAETPGLSAGVGIDQRAGGLLEVRVTSGADKVSEELENLVEYPEWLQVKTYPYSVRELEDLVHKVLQSRKELEEAGVEVVGGAFDWESGLARMDVASDAEQAAKVLQRLYPGEGRLAVSQTSPFVDG